MQSFLKFEFYFVVKHEYFILVILLSLRYYYSFL